MSHRIHGCNYAFSIFPREPEIIYFIVDICDAVLDLHISAKTKDLHEFSFLGEKIAEHGHGRASSVTCEPGLKSEGKDNLQRIKVGSARHLPDDMPTKLMHVTSSILEKLDLTGFPPKVKVRNGHFRATFVGARKFSPPETAPTIRVSTARISYLGGVNATCDSNHGQRRAR